MRSGYILGLWEADGFYEAMRTEEIKERLKLKDLIETNEKGERRERIYYVQPSIATTSDGLFEGLVSTGL